jgi:hypothetical protein
MFALVSALHIRGEKRKEKGEKCALALLTILTWLSTRASWWRIIIFSYLSHFIALSEAYSVAVATGVLAGVVGFKGQGFPRLPIRGGSGINHGGY